MKIIQIHNQKHIKFICALVFFASLGIGILPDNTAVTASVSPKVLGVTTVAARGEMLPVVPVMPLARKEVAVGAVKAQSFLVYDASSGQILAARNSTEPYAIASLTKLMTLLVAYTHVAPEKKVLITNSDTDTVSPILHLVPGDSVQMLDLLQGMMIGSANDAAIAAARATTKETGRPFVELMNETASNLGMLHTSFANPMGFDSIRNFSTAADLKLLIDAVRVLPILDMTGFKTEFRFIGDAGYTYVIKASNKLVGKYSGLLAIKTGLSPAANEAMVTKISYEGHECIFIVLDSPNREGDTLALRDAIFDAYVWQ